jgi:regulator of protease activity HflC (stomatin/prohibitin superfamily)
MSAGRLMGAWGKARFCLASIIRSTMILVSGSSAVAPGRFGAPMQRLPGGGFPVYKGSAVTHRLAGLVLLLLLVALVVGPSFVVIGPGHRGVVVMLGRVEDAALPEGFNLVLPPLARRVVPVDVRTKKIEILAEAASSDLQSIVVTGVLNYHLDPRNVSHLYRQVGLDYESIIIYPAMHESIKAATAGYRVENVLVQRAALRDLIANDLTERLRRNHIVVDAFSLANVTFSEEFDKAIERKQVAEQAALQKQYELQAAERDVEITLARAEGERKAAIIAAQGRAEARELEARAEAEALRLIAQQLRDNRDLIQYQWAVSLSPSVRTVLLPTGQSIILDAQGLVEP